jgi:tRNA (guanine-N7-)-methyltransferase
MGRRALRRTDPNLDLSQHLLVLPSAAARADKDAKSVDASGSYRAVTSSYSGATGCLSASAFLKSQFSREAPIEVEVGTGKGLFLAAAAAADPDANYLGIELIAKYARFSAARLARRGLTNAKVVQADALRVFREHLPGDSLRAVHVYFPDPWWKARHKKRRIMNEAFLQQVERTLEPGGRLHFWTDVEEYFQTALGLIARHTQLAGPFPVSEKPADHDLDYRTHFERRTRLHNQPVYRAEFRKAGELRRSTL